MNKAIRFTKDGEERFISSLRDFITLIYNDNQKINERNIKRLFDFAEIQDRNASITKKVLISHNEALKALNKATRNHRSSKLIVVGAVLGAWGWYRSYKLEARLGKLEKELNNVKEDLEDCSDSIICHFDNMKEENPKGE